MSLFFCIYFSIQKLCRCRWLPACSSLAAGIAAAAALSLNLSSGLHCFLPTFFPVGGANWGWGRPGRFPSSSLIAASLGKIWRARRGFANPITSALHQHSRWLGNRLECIYVLILQGRTVEASFA